ncbi:MAG: TatD family hydrolase [Pseudomonadota bacterium]
MKMFDPHIHMTSRTTDDYERMAAAGIQAVCEPAFWMGQPRTHVGTFEDYFLSLLGWEKFRAEQFGIHHVCTLAMNPKEANQPDLAKGVLELLPLYLQKDSVVAVGEIGLDDQTQAEQEVMAAQIELAIKFNLPILIHTPHRDKKAGTQRCLDIVKESGIAPEMVLVDHNTEETVQGVLDLGYWAGHSVYPHTKMEETRMAKIAKEFGSERIIVNSAADWGVSDPLMVPKTVEAMRVLDISDAEIETIVWKNPLGFFAQSGRIDVDKFETRPKFDQAKLFEENSVLRGQEPKSSASAAN